MPSIAVAQAAAGAHVVGPSGMMDGQVGAIRDALDRDGFADVGDHRLLREVRLGVLRPVPRRRRVRAAVRRPRRPTSRTRRGPSTRPLREARLDVAEGADIVMVKPAVGYLDVVRRGPRRGAMCRSPPTTSRGEYAMVEAAAANGWIDRDRAISELLTSIKRAGADLVLTYWATEVAARLRAEA